MRSVVCSVTALRPILCLNFGNYFVSAGTPFLNHVHKRATLAPPERWRTDPEPAARREKKRRRSANQSFIERAPFTGSAVSVPCPVVALFCPLNRPIGTRLDCRVPRLVHGTTVLEPPHFDLAEQRECRTLPQWVRLRHFEKAFSERIRPSWRNRVDICFFPVAMLQECVLDRPQKFVG